MQQARPNDEPFDSLIDPLDDGTMPLGPGQFDPLTELHGEPWPKDALEAAGYEYEIAHWLSDAVA